MFKNAKIESLEDWYAAQCNGVWEHAYGIRLRTLDNPGWHLRICLNDTSLENKRFKEVDEERSDHDWIHCRVENAMFNAHCGPKNLNETINMFLRWAKS